MSDARCTSKQTNSQARGRTTIPCARAVMCKQNMAPAVIWSSQCAVDENNIVGESRKRSVCYKRFGDLSTKSKRELALILAWTRGGGSERVFSFVVKCIRLRLWNTPMAPTPTCYLPLMKPSSSYEPSAFLPLPGYIRGFSLQFRISYPLE